MPGRSALESVGSKRPRGLAACWRRAGYRLDRSCFVRGERRHSSRARWSIFASTASQGQLGGKVVRGSRSHRVTHLRCGMRRGCVEPAKLTGVNVRGRDAGTPCSQAARIGSTAIEGLGRPRAPSTRRVTRQWGARGTRAARAGERRVHAADRKGYGSGRCVGRGGPRGVVTDSFMRCPPRGRPARTGGARHGPEERSGRTSSRD